MRDDTAVGRESEVMVSVSYVDIRLEEAVKRYGEFIVGRRALRV